MLMINICLGLFITSNQLALVIGEISVHWPPAVQEMFRILSYFALNFQVFFVRRILRGTVRATPATRVVITTSQFEKSLWSIDVLLREKS